MNYNRISENYERRGNRKFGPKRALGKIAALLLAITVVGAAAANHEKIGELFDSTIAFSSVDKDIESSYDVTDNGIGKPDTKMNINPSDLSCILESKDGIENFRGDNISYHKVSEDEVIVLEKDAALRTSAAIGENEEKTTLAILEEPVSLKGVSNYFYWKSENGDSFYGFYNDDLKKIFLNVKFEESKTVENDDDISWVKDTEASFAKLD